MGINMPDLELEWRPIPNFPEYEVSNYGEVRNIAAGRGRVVNRVLSPRPTKLGHLSVCLSHDKHIKTMQVHRLVALTFIGPPPVDKPDVAHGDGNSANNKRNNLRWATKSENENDKVLHGKSNRGERHGNARLVENDIRKIRELAEEGLIQSEIAKEINTSRRNVGNILSGKNWKHVK